MPAPRLPSVLDQLLAQADVRINGPRPWDLQLHQPRMIQRVLQQGSLGLGESYVDGEWDCAQLDELMNRLLKAEERNSLGWRNKLLLGFESLRHRLMNLQKPSRAFQVGERHYDVGPDVFEAMLDRQMVYSCACWDRAQNLEQAQQDKLELICRKLQLQPGMRVLDIGCGWGGLAAFAARHHGVQVTGITVSREQQEKARAHCAGLDVRILLQDWRQTWSLDKRYDRIVSVGMFEHVGPHNHAAFLARCRELLDDSGLMLLHTIGSHRTTSSTDPWIDRYIFPNGKLPSAREIANAAEGQMLVEDWHNFGLDYERTLLAWWHNFQQAWPELAPRYGRRFGRMWRYYLLSCAGFFRSRQGQLWQIVLSKPERRQPYRSVRLMQAL